MHPNLGKLGYVTGNMQYGSSVNELCWVHIVKLIYQVVQLEFYVLVEYFRLNRIMSCIRFSLVTIDNLRKAIPVQICIINK